MSPSIRMWPFFILACSFSRVRNHVRLKTTELCKSLLTHFAIVRLFNTTVYQNVPLKNATFSKSPVTYITLVRFFATVCQLVPLEMTTVTKSLMTHVTF